MFKKYASLYDALYNDKNYSEEVDYLNFLIKKFMPQDKYYIADYGCGTGKHSTILSELYNYNVLGIDSSCEMINLCKNNNKSNYIVADIINFESIEKFDCIISMFHVISYVNENQSLRQLFKNINKNLKPGGLFIFDCWDANSVLTIQPTTRIKTVTLNDGTHITRIAEPDINYLKNVVNVKYTAFVEELSKPIIKIFEEHPMRYFSFNEIEFIANSFGFSILTSEEMVTKRTPSNGTWAVCYTLQKNV